MEIINEYHQILFILACVFGLFMAWGIGANDVANAMGTSVGSKALTIKQAILIAMVFEFAGAYLAGGEVTSTIRKGMIDSQAFVDMPELLIFGMMASMLAAATWLLIATTYGWPVSTTHSIVGAIVGFAVVGLGIDAVKWSKILTIVASWVASPLLAGSIAFVIYRSVQRLILNTAQPFNNAQRYVPIYMFLTAFMITMVTFTKGLKHVGLHITSTQSIIYAAVIGLCLSMLGKAVLSGVRLSDVKDRNSTKNVERIFSTLMVFTACAMAFAHGSNDVANAVGPLAAVVNTLNNGGVVLQKSMMPSWILLLGGIGIVIGLATYGYKVIATIGTKITELTPSRGFSAELAAATTVVMASGTGIPISTTHTLVGAVLGVGLARGAEKIDTKVIRSVFTSWVITLPVGAGLSIIFFYILKTAFA